ncbi:MAG: recombinase family protein [Clostridiales bacterium]|nr:recombinase family protein [Clostridiales bacterium]
MKRKLRGRAYARYSSESQQESSITVQLAAIRKYCAMYDIELEHEYVDEAQTGTNANRKQFQQMVKDAPLREFDIIIVHRMDRWARNVDDARYYKKYFAQYGIKVISTIEKFDETPEGEFFELLSMGMAELYSKKLSREAVAGKIANAKLAKTHGGNPLLG